MLPASSRATIAECGPDNAVDMSRRTRSRSTWEEFGDASRELAQTIADDGFGPDVVVAIARGGLLLAGSIAYALGRQELRRAQRRVLHGRRTAPARARRAAADARRGLAARQERAARRRRLRLRPHARDGRAVARGDGRRGAHGRALHEAAAPCTSRTTPGGAPPLWITFPWSALPPVSVEHEHPPRRRGGAMTTTGEVYRVFLDEAATAPLRAVATIAAHRSAARRWTATTPPSTRSRTRDQLLRTAECEPIVTCGRRGRDVLHPRCSPDIDGLLIGGGHTPVVPRRRSRRSSMRSACWSPTTCRTSASRRAR